MKFIFNEPRPKKSGVLYIRGIDAKVKERFKLWCDRHDISMSRKIEELMRRFETGKVREVILALDPKVDGEFTAMYLARKIKPLGIKTTQLAQGVPIGRDLEFADEVTLSRAVQGRTNL